MNSQRNMALAAFMLMAIGSGARAQEAQPAPDPSSVKPEKFKDWSLVCSAPNANAPQVCEIGTAIVSDKGQRMGALAVASIAAPDGTGLRMIASALVPLGVDLRLEPTLAVGGAQPMTLRFLRCLERGCEASAPISAEQQAAMRTGSNAKVSFGIGGEKTATFDVSLAGFSAAHDGLKKRLGAK